MTERTSTMMMSMLGWMIEGEEEENGCLVLW